MTGKIRRMADKPHPTIDRQHGAFVLHDINAAYHAEITRTDLARLARQATMWIEIDMQCDGAVPLRDAEPMVG